MRKSNFTLAILLLLLPALVLTACGGSVQEVDKPSAEMQFPPEAVPAEVPENCEGFGDLEWGDSYEALMGPYVEVVQRGVSFAGYLGVVYYLFDEDGKLSRGYYWFNDNRTLEWGEAAEVYLNMRNELLSKYGEAGEGMRGTSDGEIAAAPTIYDLIEAGEGTCIDMWSNLSDSDGRYVSIALQLLADGRITITYNAR